VALLHKIKTWLSESLNLIPLQMMAPAPMLPCVGWQLTQLHIMSDLPVYFLSVLAWSLIVVYAWLFVAQSAYLLLLNLE
jgi:hypothetical protein